MKKILFVFFLFLVGGVAVAIIKMSYPDLLSQLATTQVAGELGLEPELQVVWDYGSDYLKNPETYVSFRVETTQAGFLSVWVVSQSPSRGETSVARVATDVRVTRRGWSSGQIRAGGSASRHLVVAVLAEKPGVVTISSGGLVTRIAGTPFGLGFQYFTYRPDETSLPSELRVKSP